MLVRSRASIQGRAHVPHNHVARYQTRHGLNEIISQAKSDTPESAIKTQHGILTGKSVSIKDNIVTAELPSAAASNILTRFNSPFEATVVKLLRNNGAEISAKTNMDEFGMGSHSQSSAAGSTLSPFRRDNEPLSPGGSSGGSAVAVAAGQCWAALGTDTGGSVRLPAAYTGVTGFKPSYGLLSRWGVIQYANSLDTVGILSKDIASTRQLFNILNFFDDQDPTSLSLDFRQRLTSEPRYDRRRLRVGVPNEYSITELAAPVRAAWTRALYALKEKEHSIHAVSLPTTPQALSAYYVLAPAEASSNLAKYDGVRYGQRSDGPDATPDQKLPFFARTRDAGFGDEVKRRILLGAYTLSSEAIDNYFIQAQRVRRLVQDDFNRVFERQNPLLDTDSAIEKQQNQGVDILLMPTAPTLPPTIKAVKEQSAVESYMNDVFTVPASLAGLPAVSVPFAIPGHAAANLGEDDVRKVGIQIVGQFGDDDLVLRTGAILEELDKAST